MRSPNDIAIPAKKARRRENIMAALLSILFCCFLAGVCTAAETTLLGNLYNERQWQACRIEAQRIIAEQPHNFEARLYQARAEAELGRESALPTLKDLANHPDAPPALSLVARYDAARLLWRNGQRAAAADNLREVFLQTDNPALFLEAGCALDMVLRVQAMTWGDIKLITDQINTSSAQWTPDLIQSVRRKWKPPKEKGGGIGRGVIAVYRSQIRPAIGDRCVLLPSCSEYSHQAFQQHGFFIGAAMTADRFVREPSVTAAAASPVICNCRIYYSDPLHDHDWWFAQPPDDNGGN
jgi:putative component of membrane protein insertase Oxa1/YidC/SpoIIIJ protein YidD